MSNDILKLKPEGIWKEFNGILGVPRPSKKEAKMVAYLEKWAKDHKISYVKEDCGNIIMTVPATKGMEDRQTVILQAHMDMVCEKNSDKKHDFEKDPIEPVIKGEWLHANGTTLGADDGIGVAAALAVIADPKVEHGPLECIFTVDEETGLTGAMKLDPEDFTGRILLNLDSEDEGEIFIGCAGGMDTIVKVWYELEPAPEDSTAYRITVSGLKGGHSGDDINKERANALRLLIRFLYTELQYDFQLLSIKGGNKPNAICREAEAIIAVPAADFEEWVADAATFEGLIQAEYKSSDPHLKVIVAEEASLIRPIEEGDAASIIMTLLSIPHGVEKMSMDIPGLVETSSNLAAAHIHGDVLKVITSQRSSVVSELHAIAERVEAAFFLGSFDVEHHGQYPGWKPNLDSRILKVSVDSYKRLFHTDPEVKAIHAGLECGLFLEKFPDLDMISFGPTLRNVHAPGEKLELASLDKFVAHLTDVVVNFS